MPLKPCKPLQLTYKGNTMAAQEVFTPEIDWDELDKGARIILWAPETNYLGVRKKGVLIQNLGNTVANVFRASKSYQVVLVRNAKFKQPSDNRRDVEPIYHRRFIYDAAWGKKIEKTPPLVAVTSSERLVVIAAVQEAWKICTVSGYRRKYIRSTDLMG